MDKPVILQQYHQNQVNNGGPATGALLLINSYLNKKYDFAIMNETHLFSEGIFKQFLYFYKTIREIKPDLVHIRGVQSEGFYGVLACKLLRRKVIMSVHGLYIDSSGMGPIKRFIFKHIFEKYALRNADAVYCVCKYAAGRDYIRRNTKGHLVGYIHNAVPIWDLNDKPVLRNSFRDYLGCLDSDVVFSYVGRVTEEKGMKFLLEAFERIAKNNPNAKLCLAGDGNYLEAINSKYSDLIAQKRIILLGKTKKVKEFLCASDVFVFPTLHENLSNSLLEAGVVGLPIIATNVGGNPEIIADEEMGILVEPSNTESLYTSMLELLTDANKRFSMGKKVQVFVNTNFSPQKVFSEIEKAYDSVLSSY